VGFEPAIPAFERTKTVLALESAATDRFVLLLGRVDEAEMNGHLTRMGKEMRVDVLNAEVIT
jgi:hypothetical protein